MSTTELTVPGGSAVTPHESSTEVTSLVQLAIDKGVNVEVIERLVALQERVYDRDARAAFIAALAAFQADCPQILKTRENTQFSVTRNGAPRKARYAPLEDIDRIARPIAAKHGLVWTWDTRVDDALMHVTCRVLHAMGHSETATVSMPYESKAGSSPQQKYGSTQTYGQRYSLTAALGITTADEDTDGNTGGGEVEKITDQQAADLSDLIDEVGVSKPKLLKWLGVESIADIPATEYKRAVDAVEAKRGTNENS